MRDDADAVLYLVNAAEDPAAAGYVAPELEILAWIGKPVLVLLNQTGPARQGPERDLERWQAAVGARAPVRAAVSRKLAGTVRPSRSGGTS